MTTGQRIKAARKAAGMTQKELGEKLGLSFQSIAQWENDLRNPKYDTLKRIAVALGVDREVLFTDREREISEHSDIDGWCRAIDYYNVHDLKGLIETMKQHNYTLSDAEKETICALSKLNEIGQQEAVKRVEELTEIPRYRRQEPAETPPASPGDTDTTAAQGAPEGAEEDG